MKPAGIDMDGTLTEYPIETVTTNIATTYAIDLTGRRRKFVLTATADCTLSVTNAAAGDTFWLEILSQSHNVTLFTPIHYIGTGQTPGAHSVYVVTVRASDYQVAYLGEEAA